MSGDGSVPARRRRAARHLAAAGLLALACLAVLATGARGQDAAGQAGMLPELDIVGGREVGAPGGPARGGDAAATPAAKNAAPSDAAAAQGDYDRAFQEMLRNPDDFDASFRFAQLAAELGHYEPAISALERLLLLNPDMPEIKYELGVLYYLIDSYAVARTYLTEARDAPSASDEIKKRAIAFLDELDRHLAGK